MSIDGIELPSELTEPRNAPPARLEHEVFIRRMSALCALQPHETAALSGLIHTMDVVEPHRDILKEGRASQEALVLLDGLACHHTLLSSARRQMTSFVLPGDFCDFGFLSDSPVRQCVMSLDRSVIGRINLSQLSEIGDRLPNIILAAMRASAVERSSARELVINLGARDAQQRLAHFLCEMYHRLDTVGLVDKAGQFRLALTQAEIGEALGLSTVHVNRTIQQLRRKQLIVMSQGSVTITDLWGLAAVASFDVRYLRAS